MLTDVGRKRRHNEDYVAWYEPSDPAALETSGRLYIVADGVGGQAAGEVASEYAVKKTLYAYYHSQEPDLGNRLQTVIDSANADVFAYTDMHPEIGRMGTTLVAAVIRGTELVVANIGDSRAYLIRDGEIRQITQDHSLVAQLVEEGLLSPEEAVVHPKRNVLLRSLGMDEDIHPDIFEGHIQPDDRLLLCSDGLTIYLPDAEIASIVNQLPLDAAARRLVQLANERGGKDNISLLLLHVVPANALAAKRRARSEESLGIPELETITDAARQRQAHDQHLSPWLRWLQRQLGKLR